MNSCAAPITLQTFSPYYYYSALHFTNTYRGYGISLFIYYKDLSHPPEKDNRVKLYPICTGRCRSRVSKSNRLAAVRKKSEAAQKNSF